MKTNQAQGQLIDKEIQEMLEKGAIYSEHPVQNHFLRNLFPFPQKDGSQNAFMNKGTHMLGFKDFGSGNIASNNELCTVFHRYNLLFDMRRSAAVG